VEEEVDKAAISGESHKGVSVWALAARLLGFCVLVRLFVVLYCRGAAKFRSQPTPIGRRVPFANL
jgi:hypothetical protein